MGGEWLPLEEIRGLKSNEDNEEYTRGLTKMIS